MITLFLYEIDEKKKQVLTGLVEDESEEMNDSNSPVPMGNIVNYHEKENEKIVNNYGEFFYVTFNDEGKTKYLDINAFDGAVSAKVTDNIAFASCYSKPFMISVLSNYDYFGLDDCDLIPSGFGKRRSGELTDDYQNCFKKLSDRSFCQIRKNDEVYYVGLNQEKKYILTKDFKDAIRVSRSDMRKVLIMNGFIDKSIGRHDLSYSPLNTFRSSSTFLLGGYSALRVTYINGELTISENVDILPEEKLFDDEEVAKKLKALSYLVRNKKYNEESIYEVRDKFLRLDGETYSLVSNPANATRISAYQFEVYEAAMSLYVETLKWKKYTSDNYYLYENNDCLYEFSSKANESLETGRMVSPEYYREFSMRFLHGFESQNRLEGILVIMDDKYLNLTVLSSNTFAVNWLDTAFSATLFTQDEIDIMLHVFKWKISKKEVKDILQNDLGKYNIDNKDASLIDSYKDILDGIVSKKHRIWSFTDYRDIKVESEKGALEYLRRFFIKGVIDAKELFMNVLTKETFVKNILVVNGGNNVDLLGLIEATNELNKDVSYTMIDNSRWGYYPHVCLNKHVTYKAYYRLNLNDLPKAIIESFDMILYSKSASENPEAYFNDLLTLDKKLVLADMRHCNMAKINDYFYDSLKSRVALKRKYFKGDEALFALITDESKKCLDNLEKEIFKSGKPDNEAISPIIDSKNSYHCIAIKKEKELIDYYN